MRRGGEAQIPQQKAEPVAAASMAHKEGFSRSLHLLFWWDSVPVGRGGKDPTTPMRPACFPTTTNRRSALCAPIVQSPELGSLPVQVLQTPPPCCTCTSNVSLSRQHLQDVQKEDISIISWSPSSAALLLPPSWPGDWKEGKRKKGRKARSSLQAFHIHEPLLPKLRDWAEGVARHSPPNTSIQTSHLPPVGLGREKRVLHTVYQLVSPSIAI